MCCATWVFTTPRLESHDSTIICHLFQQGVARHSLELARTSADLASKQNHTCSPRPCPCGYVGDPRHDCTCSMRVISRYQEAGPSPVPVSPMALAQLAGRLLLWYNAVPSGWCISHLPDEAETLSDLSGPAPNLIHPSEGATILTGENLARCSAPLPVGSVPRLSVHRAQRVGW